MLQDTICIISFSIWNKITLKVSLFLAVFPYIQKKRERKKERKEKEKKRKEKKRKEKKRKEKKKDNNNQRND